MGIIMCFYVQEYPQAQPVVVLVQNVSEDGPQLNVLSERLGGPGLYWLFQNFSCDFRYDLKKMHVFYLSFSKYFLSLF